MNRLIFTTAVLLVAAFYSAHAEGHCCSYPLPVSTRNVNVTVDQFTCNETIAITCQTNSFRHSEVGIAGQKKGSETHDHLATNPEMVTKAVICDSSSKLWHMEGSTDEYDRLSCAYKGYDGKWVYA